MVTRKPVGPPLSTSPKDKNANPNPPYPTTPTSSARSPVLTDLDRAKSIHSATSVYSPNLHSSPAFDLIDMNEARQRPQPPRRDSDMSSHGTWNSDDEGERGDTPEEEELPASLKPGPVGGVQARKPQEGLRYEDEAQGNPWAAAESSEPVVGQPVSNNPYRQQDGNAAETSQSAWQTVQPAAPAPPVGAPPAPPVELSTAPKSPADELSKMSLGGHQQRRPEPRPFETAEILAVPQQGRPPLASEVERSQQESQEFFFNNSWRTPSQERAAGEQAVPPPPGPPPAAPLQHDQQQYAPPPGPPRKAVASTSLIDHEDPPLPPSGEQLRPAPAHISTAPPPASRSTDSVPETPGTRERRQRSEHYQIKHVNWYDASYSSDPRFKSAMRRSPILTQNANGPCPLLALVNALVLTTPQNLDTALVGTLRRREQVSIGLLLDAVFDELMSGRRGDTAQELPDVGELYAFLLALHTGMNVNPRFITPATAPSGFLDMAPPEKAPLHPAERAQTKAGCFEETKEMRLYSTFNVPLIHGWTAPQGTVAYAAFERCAQTFEEAQKIQFLEPELEDKLRNEGLEEGEQRTLQDIQTIKAFLTTWSTQLTDYGLETIAASLRPGQTAILFRNDHFSTIYKEPKHGALMTLVTDAGYSSHDEIVWESLVDVNGAASEMFSGDFRVVSHRQDARLDQGSSGGGEEGWERVGSRNRVKGQQRRPQSGGPRVHTGTAGEQGIAGPPPLPGPRPQQQGTASGATPAATGGEEEALGVIPDHHRKASEQEDHDLALALQLQEEEEDQQRQAEQRRRREQELSERFLSTESPVSPEGPRPPIPPRRSGNRASTGAPAGGRAPVSRPAEPVVGDPDAPPSYEQSRTDRPYRPAGATAQAGLQQGNPLSAYDALRRQQSAYAQNAQQSGANVGAGGVGGLPPGVGTGRRTTQMGGGNGNRRRRSSQMGGPGPGQIPGAYGEGLQGQMGRPGQTAGVREAEDKCVVM